MPTDFDERAAAWDDDPTRVERSRAVAEAIRSAVHLGPSTRMLEYGAGTGLVSQALAEHVGPITLAEPSPGMRAVIERKRAAGALPATTRILDLDLVSDPPPGEDLDVVVTVLTLHHIRDLPPVLEGFADLLTEDGLLCIVDLEPEDGSFHRDDAGFDGHHGFAPAELAVQLEAAGFSDVRTTRCYEIEKDGRMFPLFLMVCSAPLTPTRHR